MGTFTIFCHGTASHRDREDGEIISHFGRAMPPSDEYRTFLILDGPGATGKSTRMAGTFNWATRNREKKSSFGNKEMGDGSSSNKVGGLILGSGWDDNVRHAIVTIANLDSLPHTVNLIGWSRGAVTCLKIANALFDPSTTEGLFRQINVNIFAVDPVAGNDAGIDEDTRQVNSNVRNYIGALAQDEQRGGFRAQDLNRIQVVNGAQSNVVLLPFPGHHSTLVRIKNGVDEVPKIIFHLAYKFLTHFGTRFPDPGIVQHFTLPQIVDLYAQIKLKRKVYHGTRNRGLFNRVQGGLVERSFKHDVSKYTKHSKYFLNDHHRSSFKSAFPMVYNYFFTNTVANPTQYQSKSILASSPFGQALQQLYQTSQASFETLMSLGLDRRISPAAVFTIPAPGVGGSARDGTNSSGEATQLGSLVRMGI